MIPFKEEFLEPQTFFQKILKVPPKENFSIEMNNLLANLHEPTELDSEKLEELLKKYKLKRGKKVLEQFTKIYHSYLKHLLVNDLFDDQLPNLKHLKKVFDLNDNSVNDIFSEVVLEVYSLKVKEVMSDGRIEEKEKEYIEKLKSKLMLSDEIANRIFNDQASNFIDNYKNRILEDRRLSPDEEKELYAIAKSFAVELDIDEATKATLEKFRLLWCIDNGELNEITPDINLKKTEKCYFKKDTANLHEYRRIPNKALYHGPMVRIKIMKGVYYRAGAMNFNIGGKNQLVKIDSGSLYLTNQRIIFKGTHKNQSIPLSKILDFNTYSNGIEIIKDAGKNPFFEFSADADVMGALIYRLVRESN